MKTTIAGLIPNAPFFTCIATLLLAGVCLTSSGVHAAVDDWPATASAYSSDPLEVFTEDRMTLMDLACRPEVQISLNQNGEAIVTPSMLVIAPDYPLNMYVVDIMGPLTNVVTCDNIGDELMAMVEELPTGNFCMSTLIVEDKLRPVLVCEDDTIPCNTDLQNLDILSFLDSVDDNCDEDPTVVYNYTITDLNCDPGGMAGYIDILYTATDDYGNSSTCEKRVWLEKFGLDEVEFPADTILNCVDADPDPEVIGGPTIGGLPIHHFCELVAWHTDNVIPMCSGQTKIIRLWRVMDWCTGAQISDPQEILIVDTVPPEIVCPIDLTIGTSMLQCSSTYVFPDPDVTDVCSDDNLIVVRFTLNTVPGIFLPGQNVQLGLGPHIVTVSATDNCNNTATCQYTVTVVDDDDPVVACSNLNITLNVMGMAFLNANNPAFNATDNCGVVSRLIRRMDDNCNTPENLVFGPQVKFCCADVGEVVMVIFQAMDAAGNTSTCMIQVTVKDADPPTALCMDACLSLGPDGTVTLPVDSIDAGSFDNCEIVSRTVNPSVFDCEDIGFHVVVLTVSDAQGNTATCTANVEIKDEEPPVAVCQDITVELNAMGMVTISAEQVDGGSFDNCGIDTMFLTQYDFDCDDVGVQEVDLIVVDAYGNSDTCTAEVTIDDMPPMVMCMDVTVYLDENGMVTITPDDVDGVSDDCSMPFREVDPDMFDCSDLGDNIVTLTATDNFGNTATCTAIVTVMDSIAPTCETIDITVELGPGGTVSIDHDALDGGSTDNCQIESYVLDQTTFDCDDVGVVEVVQTVTDQSGNTATCTASVTVVDDTAPICIANDITIELNMNGMASIDEDALDGGSTDNCAIMDYDLSQTTFDCDDVGVVVVIQTVTDFSGNTSTCTAEVTVEDNVAPECLTMDITVTLDENGDASISNGDVDDGSNDACGIQSITVTPTMFDCDDAGTTVTVTQTVTDVNGNTSTCTASVTVVDDTAPTCETMDITVALGPDGTVTIDSNAVDDGSTDNCAIVMISVDPNTFDCNSDEVVVVVQTVTDASGNTATCSANVTVTGGDEPEAICMDVTIYVDEEGQAFLDPEDIDGGSFSLCGMVDLDVDPGVFDCDMVGENEATLTVTDVTGSTDTCTANVTVLDTLPPVCLTQDITVYLDENGEVSITVGDVDTGTTDNCGIDTIFISQMDFTCADIGLNVIEKTAIDINGNVGIDSPSVTVLDTLPPLCLTQDITVEINGGGMVTITPDQVDNGSTDNCPPVILDVEPSVFTCDDLGDNEVILTVTDGSGNTSTCTAIVTVEDPAMLVANCQNLTVFLDANGMIVVDPEDVDNGSSGGCASGMLDFDLSETMFNCTDIGVNMVVLTVTDELGNTATCTALITVIDNLPPTLICPPDMTADCDDPIDINNLSQFGNPTTFDNCPPVMLVEDVEDNRDDCGAGTIIRTFTATDPSGNTSQCVQTITVGDDDPFGEDDITWPPLVVMLGQCSSTDPGPGNQPVIDAGDCSLISVDYDDVVEMTIDNDPNTPCIEITRTWTVIDSCQLEMGTQNGIFTFTQMIILNDNVGPVFTPLNDVTVTADTVTCEAFVMLVTSATDCGMPTTVTNSYNGGGGNASDNYPIGTTVVVFTSTDDCGNVSTLEVEVHVIDGDPPTIMCHKIIRHMNEEFEVVVLAEEFITFTPGSCTDMDDYLFSYSPTDPHDSLEIYGCQFAGSVEPVMIYTFDLDSMPIDTCRGDLDLRDTLDLCQQGLVVTGEIFSELIHMMPEVPVLISEPSMTTAYTNDHGRYVYMDLDTGATYVLTPFLDAYHKLGVSTLDLVSIQKHLLGIRQLNSPYKMIAADANNSKSVSTLDLVEIRKLLLDVIPAFQNNTSWRFVDAGYEFPDPVNPWAHAFPESIEIDSVIGNMTHKDFVGVKIGDVNNTAFLLHDEQVDVRSGNALVLAVENRRLSRGQVVDIPVNVQQYRDILGYQFALEIDPGLAQIVDVEIPVGSFLSNEWFGMKHADTGILTTLWHETSARHMQNGETLFTMKVSIQTDCNVSDIIRIQDFGLGSQAYDGDEKIIPVRLQVDGVVREAEFALFQNLPNPFTEGTVIPVQVPEASALRLEVYTSEGRLIHRDEQFVTAGYHEFNVEAEVFDRGGVYYYTVSTGRFQATRKMILLD